jgi:hypothetical protein
MNEHWERSGYCEVDSSYHIGTVGFNKETGIKIDDDKCIDKLVCDVWANSKKDIQAKYNAEMISRLPDIIELCFQIYDDMENDNKFKNKLAELIII